MTFEKELLLKAQSMKEGNEIVAAYRKFRMLNLKVRAELDLIVSMRTQESFFGPEISKAKLTKIKKKIQESETRIAEFFKEMDEIDEEVIDLLKNNKIIIKGEI